MHSPAFSVFSSLYACLWSSPWICLQVLQRHPATSMMGCLPLAFSNCLSLSHACTHKVMRGNEAGRKWVKMIKYGRLLEKLLCTLNITGRWVKRETALKVHRFNFWEGRERLRHRKGKKQKKCNASRHKERAPNTLRAEFTLWPVWTGQSSAHTNSEHCRHPGKKKHPAD